MIDGKANSEYTGRRAARFDDIPFAPLGRTGLQVSAAGFGCYRVAVGEPEQEAALTQALKAGVNLIDTSANYGDGLSEQLIAQVLNQLIDEGALCREEIVLVSKAGYLQGRNYLLSQERKRRGEPFPDLVEYDQGLEHCIHPEFLEDQLTRSLERLDCQALDVYLLHNPEYFLLWAGHNGVAPAEAREDYYARIESAFRHLEREADRGRIGCYGISSNTFPVAADRDDFTSLTRVWDIAERIGPGHRFRAIQLPVNLLERGAVLEPNCDGAAPLAFCRDKALGVLVNRPFNAMHQHRLLRLADTDAFLPREHPQYAALARQEAAIKRQTVAADADWDAPTLSQMALRALRSTAGTTCTLVGMRRPEYVADVLAELRRPLEVRDRTESWRGLRLG